MNRHLMNIAIKNLRKYRNHYIVITLIIALVTGGVITFIQTVANSREIYLMNYYNEYGTVYNLFYNLSKEDYEDYILEHKINNYSEKYGAIYYFDEDIGAIDDTLYELYAIKVKEGSSQLDDHHVLISTNYALESHLKLNDEVKIKNQTYQVQGIIESFQNIPSIIWNKKDYSYVTLAIDSMTNWRLEDKEIINDDGSKTVLPMLNRDHVIPPEEMPDIKSPLGRFKEMEYSLMITYEGVALTAFVIALLTSTTLKKRNREFALLRGIGMTTKQLVFINLLEVILSALIGVILGIVVGIGGSYISPLVLEKFYHIYLFKIDFNMIKNTTISIFIIDIIFCLKPVIHSSSQALSQAFNGRKFEYFQIRYKKFKSLNLWNIAKRELISNKRITIGFILFNITLGSLLTVSLMGDIAIHRTDSNNNIEKHINRYVFTNVDIKDQLSTKTFIMNSISSINFNFKGISNQECEINEELSFYDDKEVMEQFIIEGNLPTNEHEIACALSNVSKPYSKTFMVDVHDKNISEDETSYQMNGKEYMISGMSIDDNDEVIFIDIGEYVQTGDIVSINNKEYKISGIIISPLPYRNMWCTSKEYASKSNFDNQYTIALTPSNDDVKEVKNYIERNHLEYEWMNEYTDIETLNFKIDEIILIMPMFVGLCLFIYLSYDYMMNNLENIRLLKLIGMTERMLLQKQILKAFIVSIITTLLIGIFNIITIIGYHMIYNPIQPLLMIFVISFMSYSIIYYVPMKMILMKELLNLDQKYE